MLGRPLGWLTPGAKALSRGRKNAQDISFNFPNFIQAAGLLILLRWSMLDSQAGQGYSLSYLFGLRVPSEALCLARAFAGDRITEFANQEGESLIGVRAYKTTPALVTKFAHR